MPTLRLTQTALGGDRYEAKISLDNGPSATAQFSFVLSAQEQEDLRWYLEDYLEQPLDPAPKIAARVEALMKDIGIRLFRDIFYSSDTARDNVWAQIRSRLNETRIEITTGIHAATAIPWELLLDPLTDVPLALRAQAFVRTQSDAATTLPPSPLEGEGQGVRLDGAGSAMGEGSRIRILLVICRPRGGGDVPFRSVASRIVRALSEDSRKIVELEVLRPPTFEQLARVLREAKRNRTPYHILHFDGHGIYTALLPEGAKESDESAPERTKRLQEILNALKAITLGAPRAGKHGYLLFENPDVTENMTLVDGQDLGNLMVETGVPVLVLNACQSAFAEASEAPRTEGAEGQNEGPAGEVQQSPQEQVRAFGSFAQEVMNTGVAGIVAMRYVLYVETAKQFVTDLYSALMQGDTLGEAVSFGRKQLASHSTREIAYRPIDLQDWAVPVVYEAAPIQLFPRVEGRGEVIPPVRITLDAQEKKVQGLPPPPDAGFFGRDETLYALDRAFDPSTTTGQVQNIVLLHGYAGSGKTTTVAEFARWYKETGGLEGPILFTPFEQYKPLVRVLDAFGAVFNATLEGAGIQWLALNDDQRREVALQVMAQIPVLWIWDNVEPIAGFPAGTKSAWSEEEQKELKEFLGAARGTRAKFLLTSRRDEPAWLGDLPRRITLPPMPMRERWQLARALAEKLGRRLDEVQDWKPLLWFTQGNPLTLTVLVGQALRDGLRTRDEVERFVAKLRAGEAAFTDDEREGRTKSLGASLAYGFETAFTEDERKILALLHFFQGFVDVDALREMGNPDADYCLPEVRSLTRDDGIALLDRAAEIGLLTAHGGGYYFIHPALPWYFKNLFEQYYEQKDAVNGNRLPVSSDQLSVTGNEMHSPRSPVLGTRVAATRAFVQAMGALGDYYHRQYNEGNRDVIGVLEAEEPNLLHARDLALAHARRAALSDAPQTEWWSPVMGAMQGLRNLYNQTGRRGEWARLVEEIVPDFVDPQTDGPPEGRQEEWSLVTEYHVRLAMEARQWEEAARLQRARVEWNRQRAADALAVAPEVLDGAQKNTIRTLAVSFEQLGHIMREQGSAECIRQYQEAVTHYQRIGDRPGEAVAAFNLGHAYMTIPGIRDLAEAERWYKRDLELEDPRDYKGRAGALGQLGFVARARFKDARKANAPEQELIKHLNDALGYYNQALDLLPPNAVDDLAAVHNQLGNIFYDAGDLDRALPHYREAIRYIEAAGNFYQAGRIRRNIAIVLAQRRQFANALDYARAARENFARYGDGAARDVAETDGLIAEIEGAMKNEASGK